TQDPEDLSALDPERDVVEGRDRAETLGDLAQFDSGARALLGRALLGRALLGRVLLRERGMHGDGDSPRWATGCRADVRNVSSSPALRQCTSILMLLRVHKSW